MTHEPLLLLGASGQVGQAVRAFVEAQHPGLVVIQSSRQATDPALRFDLEDPASIRRLMRRTTPRLTLLIAAATDVVRCEIDPVSTARVNVEGTRAVASAARTVGSRVTLVSTDYVFDGTAGPYGESGGVRPINAYGRQKLEAEQIVLEADPANLVVRSCQVFGQDPRRANFVLRTADRLRAGEPVAAACDLQGTPTFAPDLAAMLLEMAMAGRSGIWHAAGGTFLSRYDLARAVASAFDIHDVEIRATSADDLADGVPRPRRAGLRNERLLAEGLATMTPLATALRLLAVSDASR